MVLAGTGLAVLSAPAGASVPRPVVYVADGGTTHALVPLDLSSDSAGAPISLGSKVPIGVAVTPDGKTALVVTIGNRTAGLPGSVIPVNTATHKAGAPIAVGPDPQAIVVTPDGRTAYVLNGNDATSSAGSGTTVTPIDLATDTAGAGIPVGTLPFDMTMSADGTSLYLINEVTGATSGPSTITPVATATDTARPPIDVAASALALSPDGSTIYAITAGKVEPIDAATGTAGPAIAVASSPQALVVLPDGRTLYVLSAPAPGSGTKGPTVLTPIDTATDRAGPPVALPKGPSPTTWELSAARNSKTVYVLYTGGPGSHGEVVPVRTSTDTRLAPMAVGTNAFQMVQAPKGSLAFVLNQGIDEPSSPGTHPLRVASTVTEIDTATNTVTATIGVKLGASAIGVAR